ncbi:synaptic vesicle glycoprotein 2A-like [Neodiprion fabricii]|uniref:synaptic vesicle glycoprotein 2A-like n=1 Tax=Neodiprion fabricii TaxID=2872261 RepID=UPI001ED8FD0C|nr:synaptic vesicle glycoprotein 2A-like [Neodiprion fabricii]XP_046420463.1 synaptic vesicle glycoprotein 2A-like [Neodiprion fabricii]
MSQPKQEHDLEPAREMFTMTIVNDALPSDIANANKESKQPADFEAAIEATEYGLYNYLLLVAIFPAGWANVFDTTTISYILPSAECDLHLSLNEKGVLNAIIYSGMITSAFLWGFLADTKGRRSLLIFGYLADSICNILSSMSQNFLTMLVFKFFSGFVISGPLAISTTYLAEFHSTKYRSATLFWTALFSAMGNVAMPALAWAIIPQSWTLTFFDGAFVFNSWRIFIFVCSMPAFMAFAALLYFPESPKYLMTQGRNDEAMAVFQRMYAMNTGNPPELFPIKSLSLEGQKKKIEPSAGRTTVSVWQNVRGGFGQIRPLFVKPYLGQFLLILALQFGSILSLNTVRLWMPQLLTLMETYDYKSHDSATLCDMISVPSVSNATSDHGFNSTTTIDDCLVPFVPSKVYINSMIISATTVLGFVVAGTLVNLMGKKNLLLLAFALPAVGIFGLNWSPSSNITLGIIAIYIALTSLSTTTIITFCVDLMPTSLRTMAVGLTMSIGRSGAMIGNVVFPILLVTGCFAPFIFVGGFLIFCFVLTIFVPKPPAKLL